ncbi:MAG TPA: DUF5666 domain-containing protein [Bryobacteraceae bacterium]|jgi:hypothetical protein
MRASFLPCIGLAFVGALAAQAEVPAEQCLGGTLISIQPDSITLKFNEKTMTFHVAPDAEIWRRGTDVEGLQELVPGDDVSLRCSRAGDGTVVASVVAAVEEGSQVEMEPHHLREITVCMGRLVGMTENTLSMKNDKGTCVVHINANTNIWRGEILHDTGALKIGDEVGARAAIAYPGRELIAEEVEANVTKVEGKIVSVRPDRIVVNDHGHVTALIDSRTDFDLDQGKLKKGAIVLAIGLDLGHNSFRATSIVVEK